MEITNNQVVKHLSKSKDLSFKVSLLEYLAEDIGIDTISETARKEGKTPRGILISNKYKKINVGKQLMAIVGMRNN